MVEAIAKIGARDARWRPSPRRSRAPRCWPGAQEHRGRLHPGLPSRRTLRHRGGIRLPEADCGSATRVGSPMPTPGNVEPAFSLGIEEEYLLVDLATRDLVADPPAELLQRCIAETDGRVSPEFLRSQLEVKTSVCALGGRDAQRAGGAAPQGLRSRGRLRHRAHRRVHASVRAAHESSAAHRPRALCGHRARSAGRSAAHDHLRHARARRASTTTSCASTS